MKSGRDISAIKVWAEKLEFYQAEEASAASPSRKFELRKLIEEAQSKVRELSESKELGVLVESVAGGSQDDHAYGPDEGHAQGSSKDERKRSAEYEALKFRCRQEVEILKRHWESADLLSEMAPIILLLQKRLRPLAAELEAYETHEAVAFAELALGQIDALLESNSGLIDRIYQGGSIFKTLDEMLASL